MTFPIEIYMTTTQILVAAIVGVCRNAERIGKSQKSKVAIDEGDNWTKHITGAIGESVLAKCLDKYWSCSVGTYKSCGDVGDFEVRLTHRSDGSLIVRPNDVFERTFFLVTGTGHFYIVRGWLCGKDAQNPQWWRDPQGRGEPGWFVPQSELHKEFP